MMEFYDRYRWAEILFAERDYRTAARELESLLTDIDTTDDKPRHGLGEARLLLARSYYHAALLPKAERVARDLLADDPVDGYAALLLARTLERTSRHDEAQRMMTLATALGAPGTRWGEQATG